MNMYRINILSKLVTEYEKNLPEDKRDADYTYPVRIGEFIYRFFYVEQIIISYGKSLNCKEAFVEKPKGVSCLKGCIDIHEEQGKTDEFKKQFKSLAEQFKGLNERRKTICHGVWALDKNGYVVLRENEFLLENIELIETLNEECQQWWRDFIQIINFNLLELKQANDL